MREFKSTPEERGLANLLVYFETRCVDHGGGVDPCHMNEEDMGLANQLIGEGLVSKFVRLAGRFIMEHGEHDRRRYFVELTPDGYAAAHRERIRRAGVSRNSLLARIDELDGGEWRERRGIDL